MPAGRVSIGIRVHARGERHQGHGTLYVNGEACGEHDIPRTIPFRISLAGEGLCCGWDSGLPVTKDYEAPFRFTGTIDHVVVDVSGAPFHDAAAELRIAMAEQ